MSLLERLKVRLGIEGDEQDALLSEMLLTAQEIFISLRYPITSYPMSDTGEPIIEPRWNGWIVSAAVELYSKMGAEGQTGHTENSISRSYEAGDLSHSLCRKVTPIASVIRNENT